MYFSESLCHSKRGDSQYQYDVINLTCLLLLLLASYYGPNRILSTVLGCIECMRCRLLLRMIAISVRQSVCHAAQLGGACSVCGAFAAAFAKSLWLPVYLLLQTQFHLGKS